jgi:hypothetical protein
LLKNLITFVLLAFYHTSINAQPLCGIPVLVAGDVESKITIHKHLSVRDINRINEGYLLLGKVDAQPYSTMNITNVNAGNCDRVEINFNIGYQAIDFYMPNDYEPGTCSYNNIYAHEQKHLDKFVDGNERAKAFIKQQYDAIPMDRHVEMYAQPDYEKAYVNLFYGWSEAIFDEINKEQKEIDDPVKHQDEINACNGELIKETDEILRKMKIPLP